MIWYVSVAPHNNRKVQLDYLEFYHLYYQYSPNMIKTPLLAPVLTLCFVQVISTALITFIFPFVASREFYSKHDDLSFKIVSKLTRSPIVNED